MKCSADPITADSSNKHRELDLAVFSEKHEVLGYGQNRKNAIVRNRVSYNRKKKDQRLQKQNMSGIMPDAISMFRYPNDDCSIRL